MVVVQVSAENLDGEWIAFYCKHCAPHLSVRKGAQVGLYVLLLSSPSLQRVSGSCTMAGDLEPDRAAYDVPSVQAML